MSYTVKEKYIQMIDGALVLLILQLPSKPMPFSSPSLPSVRLSSHETITIPSSMFSLLLGVPNLIIPPKSNQTCLAKIPSLWRCSPAWELCWPLSAYKTEFPQSSSYPHFLSYLSPLLFSQPPQSFTQMLTFSLTNYGLSQTNMCIKGITPK